MKKMKRLTVITISSLILLSNTIFSFAEDLVWNEGDKEEIFNMAKAQDRFVLLFVGNTGYYCAHCRASFEIFNDPSGPHRKIIDDNYYTWFEPYYVLPPAVDLDGRYVWTKRDLSSVELYIADYEAAKKSGVSTLFPIICVINPDDPDEDFTFYWTPESKRDKDEVIIQEFLEAITPPDMLAGQELEWYEDKSEVINLAKEQGRNIFKFVGKSTSPNSKKVMKQLASEPLMQLLEESYVLWFSSDVSEVHINTLMSDQDLITLPYITVIDPENPDVILDVVWGKMATDVEILEDILQTHSTVSNEIITSDNMITVLGNVLQISNQTNDEQIQVFTLTGQRIANIRKNGYSIQIDASNFPKGALIVCSSTGWSSKFIIQ